MPGSQLARLLSASSGHPSRAECRAALSALAALPGRPQHAQRPHLDCVQLGHVRDADEDGIPHVLELHLDAHLCRRRQAGSMLGAQGQRETRVASTRGTLKTARKRQDRAPHHPQRRRRAAGPRRPLQPPGSLSRPAGRGSSAPVFPTTNLAWGYCALSASRLSRDSGRYQSQRGPLSASSAGALLRSSGGKIGSTAGVGGGKEQEHGADCWLEGRACRAQPGRKSFTANPHRRALLPCTSVSAGQVWGRSAHASRGSQQPAHGHRTAQQAAAHAGSLPRLVHALAGARPLVTHGARKAVRRSKRSTHNANHFRAPTCRPHVHQRAASCPLVLAGRGDGAAGCIHLAAVAGPPGAGTHPSAARTAIAAAILCRRPAVATGAALAVAAGETRPVAAGMPVMAVAGGAVGARSRLAGSNRILGVRRGIDLGKRLEGIQDGPVPRAAAAGQAKRGGACRVSGRRARAWQGGGPCTGCQSTAVHASRGRRGVRRQRRRTTNCQPAPPRSPPPWAPRAPCRAAAPPCSSQSRGCRSRTASRARVPAAPGRGAARRAGCPRPPP